MAIAICCGLTLKVTGARRADDRQKEGRNRRVRLTVILGPHRSNKLPEVRRLPPRSEVVASSTTSMATPSSPGKDMSGSNAELSKLPSDLPLCFGRKDTFDNVLAVHSFDRVGMNCERAILVNVANVGVVRPKGKNLLQFKRSFFERPFDPPALNLFCRRHTRSLDGSHTQRTKRREDWSSNRVNE